MSTINASNASVGASDLGTLAIVVLKARNLPDKHTFSKQDPYTLVELGSFNDKTKVDNRGGQHPVWDDEFRINIRKDEKKVNRTLKISCFAKEPKGDDLIGTAELDISKTLEKLEFDDWVKLEKEEAYKGEVYLEMTFFPSGPRQQPIVRRPSKLHPNERLRRPQQTPPRTSPYGSPSGKPGDLPYAGRPHTSPRAGYLSPPRESESPLPPIPDGEVQFNASPGLQPMPKSSVLSGQHVRLSASQERDEGISGRIPTILRPGGPGAKGRKRQTNGGVDDSSISQPPPSSGGAYSSPYDPQLPPPRSAGSDAYGQPAPTPASFDQYQYQSQPAYPLPIQSDGYDSQRRPNSPHGPQSQQSIFQSQSDAQAQRRGSAPNVFFPEPAVPITGPSPASPPLMQHSFSYPHTPIFPGGPSVYGISQTPVSALVHPSQHPGYAPAPSPNPGPAPVQFPGAYEHDQLERTDPERETRLATRYGSPMPLPPGATSHSTFSSRPAAPSRPSESPRRQHGPSRSRSNSPPPPSYSWEDKGKAPALPPSRTPEPTAYLEQERRALERARQEEEDADFARRLAAEEEKEGLRPQASTAPPAVYMPQPQSSGSRGRVQQSAVESDEEFARRLARELNEDVVSDIRRSASASTIAADGKRMPGGYT